MSPLLNALLLVCMLHELGTKVVKILHIHTRVMQLCDILRKKAANVVSLLEPPFKSVELQSCLAWPQNETSIK